MNSKNKKRPMQPLMFYVYLFLIILVTSQILKVLDFQANYTGINTVTLALENQLVTIKSMLNFEGLMKIMANFITNVISFAPLGAILVSMVGFGICKETGFFDKVFDFLQRRITKTKMTFMLVLLTIIFGLSSDLAFVIFMPIGAYMFIKMGRHPVTGLIATFVAAAAGTSVNVFITAVDSNLTNLTNASAKLVDKDYVTSIAGNWFFIIFATIALTFLITYIVEKITPKKLQKYNLEDEVETFLTVKDEKKGLKLALSGFLIYLLIIIFGIVKFLPFSGFLLDKTEKLYVNQLLGANAPFMQGIILIFTLSLIILGILYGIGAGTLKSNKELSLSITKQFNQIGVVFLMIIVASQVTSLLRETNIGTVFVVNLINFIENSGFLFIPLIVLFFISAGLANIVLPSIVVKWSIFVPIIIPLFMKANMTPEFAQAIFRTGGTLTNFVSPIFPYFPIFLGFLMIYANNFGIGKIYRLLMPYLLGVTVLWLFIIICWYIIGAPIGPNIFPIV